MNARKTSKVLQILGMAILVIGMWGFMLAGGMRATTDLSWLRVEWFGFSALLIVYYAFCCVAALVSFAGPRLLHKKEKPVVVKPIIRDVSSETTRIQAAEQRD